MEADERVQRPAMVTGRQVRGTGDRERRRGQELLDRQAIAQLAQGGFEHPAGIGLLDELHQRLDVIGKPDGPVHDLSSRSIESTSRLTTETPPRRRRPGPQRTAWLNPTVKPAPAQQPCRDPPPRAFLLCVSKYLIFSAAAPTVRAMASRSRRIGR